ncbi:MAG: cyanophycinase [Nostocales cyanobacterium 94392]|nr:cyanophycinase [Nostocales cyanobacterium 94392]
MAQDSTRGALLIIGGAEDKQRECEILREFIRYAGGTKARVAIITSATDLPIEVGQEYIRIFEQLGVEDVRIVDTRSKKDADSESALQDIDKATGVFFTGGDQARIVDTIKDTQLDAAIHRRLSEGMIVAGTSAGAAIMPDIMIVDGDSETHPRMEIVKMCPGMGFLPGVIVDQHFSQRARMGRLISALAQQKQAVLGFGIDENTAMLVVDDKIRVIGEGAITIIDSTDVTHSNIDDILIDEGLAIIDAKLHILPQGYEFDLETRKAIPNQLIVKSEE